MKLTFSPASPFARKVRIAAIELGLIDKIELVSASVAPGTPNDEYAKIHPLKKLPVLILDNGDVILDSYVIVEYLNELAGGNLIPDYGPTRWKAWSDDHWNRVWSGMARFEARDDVLNGPFTIAQIGLVCVLGYADFRFADCGWRKAFPKLDKFHQKMLERPSVKISVPPAA